jgi:hypothetical protein
VLRILKKKSHITGYWWKKLRVKWDTNQQGLRLIFFMHMWGRRETYTEFYLGGEKTGMGYLSKDGRRCSK